MGLYDQALIKDNHLRCFAPEAPKPKRLPKGMRVEVEVETIKDARNAVLFGADIVMLDNMRPAQMKKAVVAIRSIRRRTIIEASGKITLKNIRAIAQTGVDWISVGAITHSAPALDIALEMEPIRRLRRLRRC